MNKLFYGDCLDIMRHGFLSKNTVDLIYLDPPFNSKKNYNLMYRSMTGHPVSEQVEAFCDTWELDAEKERRAQEMPVLMREHGVDEYYVEFWRFWIKALRETQPRTLAYLIYMVERLVWMRHILRPTGSLYLHCDPTVSHYIKVMLDGIFGHANFQNEIVWKRTSAHSDGKQGRRAYGNVADVILYYTNGSKYTFNVQHADYDEKQLKKFSNRDPDGRAYSLGDITGPGGEAKGNPYYEVMGVSRHWRFSKERMAELIAEGRIVQPSPGAVPRQKRYLDEMPGVPFQNIWTDISPINSQARERLGYPTQKPMELLDRIIQTSSNKGDTVFDPFCGCGTTIYSAHQNGRRWIGCDIAVLAIRLIKHVLGERYGLVEGTHYEVDGIPVNAEQAEELFKRDPFQFQHWAVELVGGFPSSRKTADKGIDGRLYFETRDGLKDTIISVKGGRLRPTDVRDLVGTLAHEENAEMAAFISLQEPTKAMREAGAKAGIYTYQGVDYPRVQFLTIREIMDERRGLMSPSIVRVKGATGQGNLPLVQKMQGEMVAE